jgi:hypothetical protein
MKPICTERNLDGISPPVLSLESLAYPDVVGVTDHQSFPTWLPPSVPDATIWCSMIPANSQLSTASRPRVGIPWRTTQEQRDGTRDKLDFYFRAVRKAGAEPLEVSLEQSPEQLARQLEQLDAFVLPGSPADVDPSRYDASKHPKTTT